MKGKKRLWLLLGVGFILSVVSWPCCMLLIQLGSESSLTEEKLVSSSEAAYRFDPQTVLQSDAGNGSELFEPMPFPDKFPEPTLPPVSWTQEDYLRVTDLFMRDILHEQLGEWKLHALRTGTACAELSGATMQSMSLYIFNFTFR